MHETDEQIQNAKMAEAEKHLTEIVDSLMDEVKKLALEKLKSLQLSGVDIVTDHIQNNLNYHIPKSFICAFADEMKRQYSKPNPTAKDKKRIKNYYTMM